MRRVAAPTPDQVDRTLARIVALHHRSDGVRLAGMLRENGSHFHRLSAAEAERIRGHLYAALAHCNDAGTALQAAHEDLRTSDNPVVLAGVARLAVAAGTASAWRVELEAAAQRIALIDRHPGFLFDPPATCCAPARTALQELQAALAQRPAAADTARAAVAMDASADAPFLVDRAARDAILFEDQDGARVGFSTLTEARPSVIAFFYTRCMNPQKCSLTISRLGDAMRGSEASPKFNVYAISYDPDFDDRARLHGYGVDRGFPFAPHARLLRCVLGRRALASAFALRVGYGSFTVNAHARELFLLSPEGVGRRLHPDAIASQQALAAAMTGD